MNKNIPDGDALSEDDFETPIFIRDPVSGAECFSSEFAWTGKDGEPYWIQIEPPHSIRFDAKIYEEQGKKPGKVLKFRRHDEPA
jgi:hypothetical protein